MTELPYSLHWDYKSNNGAASDIVDCGSKKCLESELREKIDDLQGRGWKATVCESPLLSVTFESFDVTITYSIKEPQP